VGGCCEIVSVVCSARVEEEEGGGGGGGGGGETSKNTKKFSWTLAVTKDHHGY